MATEDQVFVSEYSNPFNYGDGEYNSYQEFADEYGLHHEFIPFSIRQYSPPDILIEIAKVLPSDRPTVRRITSTSLSGSIENKYKFDRPKRHLRKYMAVHGWWFSHSSSNGSTYANRNYIHSFDREIVRDTGRRLDMMRNVLDLGFVDAGFLARAFGFDEEYEYPKDQIRKLARRNGIDWNARRQRGKQKMAQTWATIYSMGYTYPEIGQAFNTPASTVRHSEKRWAGDGFKPPDDPTENMTRSR